MVAYTFPRRAARATQPPGCKSELATFTGFCALIAWVETVPFTSSSPGRSVLLYVLVIGREKTLTVAV